MAGNERQGAALLGVALALCLASLSAGLAALPECPIQMRDVTRTTGITFVHTDGSYGNRYVFEPMTGGVALFDYNNDGLLDIYFVSGRPLRGAKPDATAKNRLYRNDGNFKFTDVTDGAAVGGTGYALGVAIGDYNNDGYLDIYVNNLGPNVLYRNNGNGTFADVTREAGVACPDKVGAGTDFLDIDGDGSLDLFVGCYVKWSYESRDVRKTRNGVPVYPGPRNYPPSSNFLYRNNGNGTFTDVSAASGMAAHLGAAMGTVCADYDNDGDTDIFVANDEWPNFLFRNDGTGRFEEVALLSGIAFSFDGNRKGSMGMACGDYDNDGRLDFHVTAFQTEMATLYRNLGNGLFEDVTHQTGAGQGTLPCVTWGNGLVDFDNDGHKDIFMACGHLDDNVERFDSTTTYAERNLLLRNNGQGRFVNVSDQCGDGLAVTLSSRGAAFGDLDNDGNVDAVVLNSRREPTILRNVSNTGNHWIQIEPRGVKRNLFGVGSRVKVVAGDLTQIGEVHSGQGYQGHFGMRLHFGLGKRDRIDRVEVRWHGGSAEVFENVRVDQIVTLTQGTGKPGQPPPAAKPPSKGRS